jgi:hypothetical protein
MTHQDNFPAVSPAEPVPLCGRTLREVKDVTLPIRDCRFTLTPCKLFDEQGYVGIFY